MSNKHKRTDKKTKGRRVHNRRALVKIPSMRELDSEFELHDIVLTNGIVSWSPPKLLIHGWTIDRLLSHCKKFHWLIDWM